MGADVQGLPTPRAAILLRIQDLSVKLRVFRPTETHDSLLSCLPCLYHPIQPPEPCLVLYRTVVLLRLVPLPFRHPPQAKEKILVQLVGVDHLQRSSSSEKGPKV